MNLKRIAIKLQTFRFSKELPSFKWTSLDGELRETKELLENVIAVLSESYERRFLIATKSTIENILESRRGGANQDWLKNYSSQSLQNELQKAGRLLRKAVMRSRKVTRRSFLKFLGFAAAGIFAGRTILWSIGGEGEDSRFGGGVNGYYIQLGAFSSKMAAKEEAERLAQSFPALGTLVIVKFEEEVGPFKIFIEQRFESFDDVENISGLLHSAYPSLSFGIVRVFPGGSRRWLSTFLNKTGGALRVIKKNFKERNIGGLAPLQRRYFPFIEEACARYPVSEEERVDPLLVLAMMKAESNYNPKATSEVHAMGLLQLMPGMWNHFHKKSTLYHGAHPKFHDCNPYDPVQNIDAGVHMISYLHQKYKAGTPYRMEKIIMAYHAGETNVNNGVIGKRTRAYRDKVLNFFDRISQRTGSDTSGRA